MHNTCTRMYMRTLSLICPVVRLHVTKESTAFEIIEHFEGEKADLVICDGAPDGKL